MCMVFIFMIALLIFVFLAYQLKTNFKSVKTFLIKSCTVLLFLFIISIIPQTQVFSEIITPILCHNNNLFTFQTQSWLLPYPEKAM